MQKILSIHIEKKYQRRKKWNFLMCILLGAGALLALLPLLSVFAYVLTRGLPALNLSFFTELPHPVGEPGGGMANAIVGTLTLISLASFIGIPWGVFCGIYLSEYGSGRFGKVVRFCCDLLTSIPSIIIGLCFYEWMVLPLKSFSALAGGVALAVIMLPIVARSVEEILRIIPTHIREAGLALGLPRWKVILRIVLTANSKGIVTGIMLAIARVAGETAPLLFTAFGNQFWQHKLTQPIASLPVQVYTYAISPYQEWQNQAWAGALVLVLLVFLMNLSARFLLTPAGRSHT